jgi:hypothetical protein
MSTHNYINEEDDDAYTEINEELSKLDSNDTSIVDDETNENSENNELKSHSFGFSNEQTKLMEVDFNRTEEEENFVVREEEKLINLETQNRNLQVEQVETNNNNHNNNSTLYTNNNNNNNISTLYNEIKKSMNIDMAVEEVDINIIKNEQQQQKVLKKDNNTNNTQLFSIDSSLATQILLLKDKLALKEQNIIQLKIVISDLLNNNFQQNNNNNNNNNNINNNIKISNLTNLNNNNNENSKENNNTTSTTFNEINTFNNDKTISKGILYY